ncbi:AzlC family ABC transporter permease [Falsibacillus albus]|uniref:Branched-chain amino acid ABC transporter permease n=1 Tax=Falsibacillus albus TaxID=2478915 RepID=A0A3L7K2E2_9BACI|nr:AzlC family ABC transporter permease [Falsibacillus albus]RLQ97267.1 branched-chain amino acid ABC transporter permease [Falsibacillus albus]
MELSRERIYVSDFRQGLQGGVSIGVGYLPIALTFGLLAKTTGLSLMETVSMSVFVFAGASQYISLSLIAVGASVFEIILTTFIVNIRHLLMSASLNEKVEPASAWTKSIYAFGITDETFSVAATREGTVKTGYIYGVIVLAYGSWVINSGIGYLIGASLPHSLQESMTVALYAMFVGLLVPSLKKSRKVMFLAVLAAAFHSILEFFSWLSAGWAIVCSTLLSSIIVEGIEYLRKKGGMGHGK